MFESSYASMLKKATKEFKKKPLNNLRAADDQVLLDLLYSVVSTAIASYQKGSTSENREKDIEVIQLIFNHCPNVAECRKKLELYFSGKSVGELFKNERLIEEESDKIKQLGSHHFKTGLMDGSKLEDYVVATIDSFYEHIIQPLIYASKVDEDIESIRTSLFQCLKNAKSQALLSGAEDIDSEFKIIESQINTIDGETSLNFALKGFASAKPPKNSLEFFFKENIQPILAKNIRFNEDYSEKTIQYEFKDFLSFHLEKYRQAKGVKQGELYKYDEGIIDRLIKEPDLKKIRGELMSPLLKKHLINARDEFQKHQEQFGERRQVKVKTWEKEDAPQPPKKIIIALHGWRDSVECWNNLGQAAIEKGYKVMAYDHRGYGFDSERGDIGHNNDHLSIDFRKFVQSVVAENPGAEINLVGHSMGGAVLLNNQDFIAGLDSKGKPAIKSVTCFSPAVTPSLPSFFGEFRNALLGREAHEEALARQQNNQPRFVKPGLSHPANILKMITTLPYLFAMMIQAYQSLKSLVKQPTQDNVAWTIFYGEKDKAVPFSSFKEVQEINKNDKVSFKGFSRGDHLLTQGRHATVALDEFFEAIESKRVDPIEDDGLNESTRLSDSSIKI